MNIDNAISIGIDFGSDSVRALAVRCADGRELASAAAAYPRWARGLYCDPAAQRYRHHPADYIEAMTAAVREVGEALGAAGRAAVVGIGIDSTGSTPAPIDAEGRVLALRPEFAENPDAMFVLWKDHTAIAEAQALNDLAHGGTQPDVTREAGGVYSSEWWWAKILHVSRSAPAVAAAACSWVELCDWMPALLAGRSAPTVLPRGRCAAGHKALWSPRWGGLPPAGFLQAYGGDALQRLDAPLYRATQTAEVPLGRLDPDWAERLGLPAAVVVAGGAFDCHMGAVGAGVAPGMLVKVIGTSTCDITVVDPRQLGERTIAGICGQVEGSVLPGWVGLEAGQSAFGDLYAWMSGLLGGALDWAAQRPELAACAPALAEARAALLPALSQAWLQRWQTDPAATLARTPLMLDWINGRRSPGADQRLQGVLGHLTLASDPVDLFGAALLATAFGARAVNEAFERQGVPVRRVRALGGIARKAPALMQLLADVCDREVEVVASDECCALGAAIFGAVAAGAHASVEPAMAAMASPLAAVHRPDAARHALLQPLFQRYQRWVAATEPLHAPAAEPLAFPVLPSAVEAS
ncbi:ribulokinase [Sphaerotilus uruguayifluvii]|uniref:Ribulokinase n=1 Tax=Sphaerotilus uruguayifluvii TaxID=2735897 RepID=A0ABX2G0X7_9BURK|nr:L-ribulokinase [Leptothrix sp. C29]